MDFEPDSIGKTFTSKQIYTDREKLQVWGKDWTNGFKINPRAIVLPENIEQVKEIVSFAIRENVQLVPSGGRTGLSGGAVASNGEIVVSFDRMNAIKSFNASDKIVTCEPGLITADLQTFAKEQGFFYPVDFASAGSSQIGGNVATNAGGIKVIRYGLTRDWVAGLKVVTGTGHVLDCNFGLVKNATGYDFRHLMIGSEGTLGLIVEVDIRLTTPPPPQMVMVLAVEYSKDLIKVLKEFSKVMPLSAFEFFSDLALSKVLDHRQLKEPFAKRSPFYALLEFDASQVEEAGKAFEVCEKADWVQDAVLSQTEHQARELWQLREGISESIASYTPYKNDLSVRIEDVPEFLEEVDAYVANSYPDFEVCWYGHIGDGNLHLNILRPEELSIENFFELGHEMSPKIFELVSKKRGSISAEHGVGLLKKDFLSFTRSEEEIRLMQSIKNIFDPHQILNADKLIPARSGAD